MQLNWSTFALEIVNFLVLVWILKRFLYKPVLEVIARRRTDIEKTMAEARALRTEAETLQAQYQGRLAEWNEERQRAREGLNRELDGERARKTTELQNLLEQEREKARISDARQEADAKHKIEQTALTHGAEFATRLLEQAAGPDTETRIIELVIGELAKLPAERVAALRNVYRKPPEEIEVVSAFPIPAEQRKRLEQALTKAIKLTVPIKYIQETELIAGLHITVGGWLLEANLRDELKGFIELTHEE